MYGQIETWDKMTKQGTIFTADSRKPIPFQSNEDWEVGACVEFDLATIAIRVRKNTTASISPVINVRSDAAAATKNGFNHAYHNQLGDREAIEASEAESRLPEPTNPTVIDCEAIATDETKSPGFRPWQD